MKKLQTSQFYQDEILTNTEQYKEYVRIQIERHSLKKDKKRDEVYYKKFFGELIEYLDKSKHYEMICYGTRNNNERDLWKHLFNQFKYDVAVYSLDIAPDTEPSHKPDFVYDFNKLPGDFIDKWDIIFSNAIDHAPDATTTFNHWLKTLNIGGLLVLEFYYNHEITGADCSTFDESTVTAFFNNEHNDFEVLNKFKSTYVIRRVQ